MVTRVHDHGSRSGKLLRKQKEEKRKQQVEVIGYIHLLKRKRRRRRVRHPKRRSLGLSIMDVVVMKVVVVMRKVISEIKMEIIMILRRKEK